MFKFLKKKLDGFKEKAGEEFATDAISEDSSSAGSISDGSGKKIKENKLEDLLWDLEVGLMEADVAVEVIEKLKEELKADLVGKRVSRGAQFEKAIQDSIKRSLEKFSASTRSTSTIIFETPKNRLS